MFCPACGKEIPDGSTYCSHCGKSAQAGASGAGAPAKPISRNVWGILAVVFLLVIWWAASRTSKHTTPFTQSVQQLTAQPRAETITSTAFTVKANGYLYYRFVVPPGATNVSVDGHFSAAGGSGNDVEVYLLGEDAFVNFQNGHSSPTYYNSGKVTQNSLYATLPAGPGTYYLVFNNNFSLLTPKAVQATATLHYTL